MRIYLHFLRLIGPSGVTECAGGSLRLTPSSISASPYVRACRGPYASSDLATGPENLPTSPVGVC
eukprot:1474104-Pyramimonas_sp.AAC.1